MRIHRAGGMILLIAGAIACSLGPVTINFTDASPTPTGGRARAAATATQTPAAGARATATAARPSPTTAASAATATRSGGQAITYPAKVTYKDAAGDCLSNTDGSTVACSPKGVDILSVTATRPDARGPLTIVLELAGSIKGSSLWAMAYAIDLDRNSSTGMRDVYPSQHGMGPELYLLYAEVDGQVKQIDDQYDKGGSKKSLDPSLVRWSFTDDTHLQTVIDASLITAERFDLVGDMTVREMFDHFVEEGYLRFPEGTVQKK